MDEGAEWMELGLWAAHGMYEEWGGAPGAGVVAGIGRVCGRLCMIVANDATVKAGAFFPMSAKKGAAGAGDCAGEPDSYFVSGGFEWSVSAAARGGGFRIRMILGGCFGITR